MAYIYRHIRLDTNQPFYIGMTVQRTRPYERASREIEWKAIANQTPIRVEILFDDLTKSEAIEKEIELIALYKRQCDGGTLVNKTLGGMGIIGVKKQPISESTRLKMSLMNKGVPKPNQSIAMKGKPAKNRKPIYCGLNGKTYESMVQASKDLGLAIGTIHGYLNNTFKNKYKIELL
jgi:predicted GIY-YIG superfamily endonuclease